MQSDTGRPVVNQFLISTSDGVYFQSYNSMIAAYIYESKTLYIDKKYWNYSITTKRYLQKFCTIYDLGHVLKQGIDPSSNTGLIMTDLNGDDDE